jgi:hypothetical protein
MLENHLIPLALHFSNYDHDYFLSTLNINVFFLSATTAYFTHTSTTFRFFFSSTLVNLLYHVPDWINNMPVYTHHNHFMCQYLGVKLCDVINLGRPTEL